MNRMIDLKMMIKATLIVTLSLAIIFVSGCRRKQPDKSAKTPPAPVSNNPKSPQRDDSPQRQTPAVEASDQNVRNVEANDQNVVPLPYTDKKETVTVPDTTTNTKETVPAVPKTETQAAVSVPQEPEPAEQSSPAPPEEMTSSEPLDLNSFGKMDDTRKKLDFISKFAGKSPELIPDLVDMALDDKDSGVRAAAMDELAKKGFYSPEIIPVVEKAMNDADPAIRQKAVDACAHITDPAVSDIIKMALQDETEDVRAAAVKFLTEQKDPAIRLPVLEAGMASQFDDVKAGAATELMNTGSPAAVDILLTGLKDPDPEFQYNIKSMLNFKFGQEFETYDQAKQWWNENRQNYDENLKLKVAAPVAPASPNNTGG
jgi:HEAT repeats